MPCHPSRQQTRCDGCGCSANEAHLRERVARLERATRFRPIHIGVLFLFDAPPLESSRDFYCLANDLAGRSASSRAFFRELMHGAGLEDDSLPSEEAALAEFQRRGFYLAYACECPLEEGGVGSGEGPAPLSTIELAPRFGATVVKRIQFSYKPKRIVLLSGATRDLIPLFEESGLGDRLLLDHGGPFDVRPGFGLEVRKLLTRLS
jgi:hypothetical protein